MGILRSGGIFLLALVFFIAVFFANVFLNLTWSLEYNTLEPNLIGVANKFINQTGISEEIDTGLTAMEFYCMAHTNYIFMQEDLGVEIPCSIVDSGVNNSVQYVVEYLVYKIYYDSYNCDFWSCVKESKIPFVLISEKAKDYWHNQFKTAIYALLIVFVLSIILVRKKANAFINAGILTILAAILFKQFDWIFKIFPDNSVFELLDIFLAKSLNVLVIMCVIGGLLVVLGVLFRFFKLSTKISNLFRKKENKKELSEDSIREMIHSELNPLKSKKTKKSKKKKSKKNDYKDLTK